MANSYPRGREPICPVCGVNPIRSDQSKRCKACRYANKPLPPGADTPSEPATPTESFTVKGDTGEVIKTTRERVRTLEDLIRVCEIDTAEWEVERWVANKWDMGMAPRAVGSTQPVIAELYQVKAWLKRKVAVVLARAELDAMKEDAKARALVYPPVERPKRTTGNMLEINLPDHHVGKLAWGKETGYEDYDVKIAERIFDEALAALIARTASYDYDRITFVVGNDLLHADNKQGTTTKGTQVTMDSRYPKTFTTVRRMIVRGVERLRSIAPVTVVIVPGNHDELSAWCLGDSLESWFHACSDVTIDNAPTMRKYCQWGQCMLMWTHGCNGRLENYPLLMASERPEMWGDTLYREAHTGDKHQRKLVELNGVAVRILPTLCATDDWHSKMHFVGNVRCAEAYIWNRDEGLIGTAVYTVPAGKDRAA
jgi:hypothetical protein